MSSIVPFNATNVSPTQSNVFQYNFPTGSQVFKDRKIAISNMEIPYSWFNITSTYANNTLSLIFPTGATSSTISITIPNGFYTITQLNAYLQSVMIANKFYLVNGSTNVYYLEFVANQNTGNAQLNSYQVPTTTSYTNPGWVLPTAANQVPQVVISNQLFGNLIGFSTGTYPSAPTQASTYSVQSSFTPVISPVSAIYVCISCVNNVLSSPNNICGVVPINATFQGLIQFLPPQFIWLKALDGTLSSITLTLYDQNMRPINFTDTSGFVANILIE